MFYHVACARKFTTSLKSRDVVERSVGGVASFGWRDLEGDLGEEECFCLT